MNENSSYKLKNEIKQEEERKKEEILNVIRSEDYSLKRNEIEKNIISGLLYLKNNEEDNFIFSEVKSKIDDSYFEDEFYSAFFKIINKIYEDIITNKIEKLSDNELFDLTTIEYNFLNYNDTKEENLRLKKIYEKNKNDGKIEELIYSEITGKNILTLSEILKNYHNDEFLLDKTINYLINIDSNDMVKSQNDFSDLVDDVQEFISKEENNDLLSAKEIAMNDWFTNIDDIYHGKTLPKGLPLGTFKELNSILMGLKEGQMITIGARPAVGKTAFALNLINETLQDNLGHEPVIAFFSLEMNKSEILDRLASMNTGIDSTKLKDIKELTEDDMDNLYLFSQQSMNGLYINDNPNITPAEIENQCTQLKNKFGYIDLIVVDYLQIITGNSYNNNRQQEVSAISRKIKMIAKQLKTPFVVLAQLSRNSEQRQEKRPVLSDIRESGSIEQDSDIVMFLYRDDYYSNDFKLNNQTEEEQSIKLQQEKKMLDTFGIDEKHKDDVSRLEVIIAKNRSGRRGTIEFDFHKNISKFIELQEKIN